MCCEAHHDSVVMEGAAVAGQHFLQVAQAHAQLVGQLVQLVLTQQRHVAPRHVEQRCVLPLL